MSKAEQAAKVFFYKLTEGQGHILWDYTDHKAKPLVLAAFELYAQSWGGFDVRRWEWPGRTLDAGEAFKGDEPWTVLLRRAVEIARPMRQRRAA